MGLKKERKKAFCFTDDSSSDVPLSKLVSSARESTTAVNSGTHPTENPRRTMASENKGGEGGEDESSGPSTAPLSNHEDSNSSDGPLFKLEKGHNILDQDEASSDVPLSIFKKEVNQIIDENSNSSDVPLSTLRAKKVMIDEDSNSSDAPLNILKKPTEKSHDTVLKKRKRALSSDEESVQPKVRKTKKDLKESKTSGAVKRNDTAKRVEDTSGSSDDEILPRKSRQAAPDSKPKIDSESESDEDDEGKGRNAKSNCENEPNSSSEDEEDHPVQVKRKKQQNVSRPKSKGPISLEKSNKKDLSVKKSELKDIKSLKKSQAKRTPKKEIEAPSSSSSDELTDDESSESSDDEPASGTSKNTKEDGHQGKTQPKKASHNSLNENDAIKEKAAEQAQSEMSTSNSGSSNESDNDDKENVKSEKSNRQPSDAEKEDEATSNSSDSSDSEEIVDAKKSNKSSGKKIASKEEPKTKKKKVGDSSRIVRLQRYLKEAGIRVGNYKTLWEGCKSEKAKAAKLLGLLEEHGLKGKPTLSECKKLRKKLEREREVAELNTSNIIQSTGRPRRNAQSLYATSGRKNEDESMTTPKKSPEFKKAFSRLKAIVDSEDSD